MSYDVLRLLSSSLFVLALLAMAGCSVFGETDTLPSLEGTRWNLTAINGETTKPIEEDRYEVWFGPDNNLSAKAECNDIYGEYYEAAGGQLRLDLIYMTYVGCPDDSFEWTFIDFLGGVRSFEHENDRLILRLAGKEVDTLHFIAVES